MNIYNSLSQKKEQLKPLVDKQIKMYVCGPTLYDEIHIGNARPIIFFDVVYRCLQALGYQVDYVSNITDIDDKIVKKAQELNLSEAEVVANNKVKFNAVLKQLNVLELKRPEVTDYIQQIIKLISNLITEDYAYITTNGDVAFRVDKISDYGKISHQNIADLIVGNRVEEDKSKENKTDFILWKKVNDGIVWEAPFGSGRPGWHSECVVMIRELLGERIDIHGGGVDLKFPHHENENAQNEAVCGHDLANIWMHNGFVNINSEKMSKSLNNFVTVASMLEKYNGNIIRLLLLQNNYRQEINLNEGFISETEKLNTKIQSHFQNLKNYQELYKNVSVNTEKYINEDIKMIIEDDFNTPNLITLLLSSIKEENNEQAITIAYLLGLTLEELAEIPAEIITLAKERDLAKGNKNYELADKIRQEIENLGYQVLDSRDGFEVVKK